MRSVFVGVVLAGWFTTQPAAAQEEPIKLKAVLKTMKSTSVDYADGTSNLVNMDFPEPTDIKDITRAVALWTGKTVVLDRNVRGKTRILAPEKMTLDAAYKRWLAALQELGLGVSEHHGVVAVVPLQAIKEDYEALRAKRTAPALATTGDVTLDFPDPTEIRDVAQAVSTWSGRVFVLDRNVNGKVQIIQPKKVSATAAHHAYLAALDILGLTEHERGAVVQLMPIVTAMRRNESQPELRTPAPPVDARGTVTLQYKEPTDIAEVLRAARPWLGRDMVLDRDTAGRISIYAANPMTRGDAYLTLVAALDLLGLTTTINQDGSVRVLTYRVAAAELKGGG